MRSRNYLSRKELVLVKNRELVKCAQVVRTYKELKRKQEELQALAKLARPIDGVLEKEKTRRRSSRLAFRGNPDFLRLEFLAGDSRDRPSIGRI
jgi:hypothetical protein